MAAPFSKTASNGLMRRRKTRPGGNAFSSTPRPISIFSKNIPRPRHGWRLAKTSCSRSTTPSMKSPTSPIMNSTTHSVISTNIARIDPAVAAPLCRGAGNLDAATERRGYKIMRIGLNLVASMAFVAASSHSSLAKTAVANQTKPRIEVCFVLDTTGSMGGLIEGAKQKIWSIANEMISTKPTPELKLGLIGYRDRGDEYVVKSFQLTDDIDSIYGHLRDFKAIGVMDDELARLNKKIGATLIPYGDATLQREVAAKQAFAESAPASAAADRLSYNARTGKAVQGRGELLDALAKNEVKLDAIDKKDLPKEFQKLTKQEMDARIAKTRAERDSLQKEVQALAKKREVYIQAENKRLAEAGKGDGFDEKVTETIHQQAERKGIDYTP